jgi:solute carrier family 13 (sodium-dependent dicarboxylate transporter), member 2/3/5
MSHTAHSIDSSFCPLPHTQPGRAVSLRGLGCAGATIAACLLVLFVEGMPQQGRLALTVFVLAIGAWVGTRLPETAVAVVAASALVLLGVIDSEQMFSGLGDDVVWLLIGAFLIAAVVRSSGLAERFVLQAIVGSSTIRGLFHRLTWLTIATAFVVPSTSGRAALLLPVYLALIAVMPEARLRRALALLFPTIILLSACASLLGAGAHLVAVDFMAEIGLRELSFFDWAIAGTPFAIVTSLVATETILLLFVDAADRGRRPQLPLPPQSALNSVQKRVTLLVLTTVGLWATSAWHGIDPALIAILAAMAMASKTIGGVSLKDAMKNVEWNLILFLAATLVLGEALLDSGAADWMARTALKHLPGWMLAHPIAVVVIAALIAMTSHLLIASRSARAAVLIPAMALPLAIAPAHAALLIMVTVVGSGFCQTFQVSAKPVTLYSEQQGERAYTDADLMRLSLWLMPPFAVLLVLFAVQVWPRLGLGMSAY